MVLCARDDGRVDCRSVPDGALVAELSALDLGELEAGILRASLSLGAQAADAASVEFWIDGGDLAEGAIQPFWTGPVEVTGLSAGGANGTVTFAGLARELDQKPGDPAAQAVEPVTSGLPATMSGTLSWTCRPW
jgi:hypothetical protein